MTEQALKQIKKMFTEYRKTQKGKNSQSIRYPDDLKKLIIDGRASGATLSSLADASGISIPGVMNITKKKDVPAKKSFLGSLSESEESQESNSPRPTATTGRVVKRAVSEDMVTLFIKDNLGTKELSMRADDIKKVASSFWNARH